MKRVLVRSKVSSSTFGKLPNGAIYWLSATSGPFVKISSGHRLSANSDPQTTPVQTAVADRSVPVIKQDLFTLKHEGS